MPRGHVRKRGHRWAAVVYLGKTEAGRDRYKWTTFDTRREAQDHVIQVLAKGGALAPARQTFSEYLTRWLETASLRVRPTTKRVYDTVVRIHLRPDLGSVPLAKLTSGTVEAWLRAMCDKTYIPPHRKNAKPVPRPLSAATVHQSFRVLRTALRQAVTLGMLTRSPLAGVKAPRLSYRPMRVWDEEQVRVFLATARRLSRNYAVYLTAILTGMRQGELLALRWRDVDLDAGRLSVQHTLRRSRGVVRFAETKTARSRRTISLPRILVRELEHLRGLQAEFRKLIGPRYTDHDLVLSQGNGLPLHANNLSQRELPTLAKTAGVPRIRFHDLRHVYATLALRFGTPVKVVAENLGHANISTTMNVYAHVLAPMLQEASETLATRLLGGHLQGISKKVGRAPSASLEGLEILARPEGFEPPTRCLEGSRSIP